MRTLWIAIGILVAATTAAPAQHGDRFVTAVPADTSWSPPTNLCTFDRTGAITATLTTFPSNTHVHVLALRGDNRTLLLSGVERAGTMFTSFLADVTPGGQVTTIHKGAPLGGIIAAVPDCNGGLYVLHTPDSTGLPQMEILQLGGSTLTRLSMARHITAPYGVGGLDPETGQLCFKGAVTYLTPMPSRQDWGYFRIDPISGAITSIQLVSYQYPVAFQLQPSCHTIWEYPSGTGVDVFRSSYWAARTGRVVPGQGITGLSRTWWGRMAFGVVRAGQRTAATAYYTLCMLSSVNNGKCRHWELVPIRPDGTWGRSIYLQNINPTAGLGLFRLDSRNLSWRMVAPPNGRRLDLSFPGEGGRAYAVVFSFSGVRPGIPLPDGRAVPIQPDALTLLSLRGGAPGVLGHTTGRLDASGRASVTVDTNGFGSGLKGNVFWAAALVFDPNAPSGVAWIVGPERLEIRQ